MHLPKEYYRPFNITYTLVTLAVRRELRLLSGPKSHWLRKVTRQFLRERRAWNHASEFRDYREQWKRLKLPSMRLAAAAYLHISYDLPRVLADQWPGTGIWTTAPDKNQAYQAYFSLEPIFAQAFATVATRTDVVGRPSWLVRLFSGTLERKGVLKTAGQWVLMLRARAWLHGEQLAAHPARATVERAMLNAMTLALTETVRQKAWGTGLLEVPEKPFRAQATPILAGLALNGDEWAFVVWGLVFALALVWWSRERVLQMEAERFVDDLGRRTLEYVSAAVKNPESFLDARR